MNYGSGLKSMRIQLIVQEEKRAALLQEIHQQELATLTQASGGITAHHNNDSSDDLTSGKGAAADAAKSDAQLVQDAVDRALFNALDAEGLGEIPSEDVAAELRKKGLLEQGDRRLARAFRTLRTHEALHFEQFQAFLSKNLLVSRAFNGELVIGDFPRFCAAVEEMWEAAEPNHGGANADYIPALAVVDAEQWGVAVCTVDGQRFSVGDCKAPFCVQSSSKPLTYCMAQELHGEQAVHRHIGREPSGRRFNERVLKKQDDGKGGIPHNPYINAGAIMAAALVKAELREDHRFDYVVDTWTKLAGYPTPAVAFQNSTYMGERATASRNFCLGYMMEEQGAFPAGTDLIKTLESYFMYCSLELDAESEAVVAATLANGGICPTTGERVFQARTVRNALCLMMSCGMYDYSGEYAFKVGIPTKSGVSGVLCIVVPGVTGIATFSPRLDKLGNSVRGQDFCKLLCARYPFHMFASLPGTRTVEPDPTAAGGSGAAMLSGQRDQVSMWFAAADGDLTRLRQLVARGADVAAADYDGRTALHLAASNARLEAARYLTLYGADHAARDRHGNTPLDDARREGHAALESFLVAIATDAAEEDIGSSDTPGMRRAAWELVPDEAKGIEAARTSVGDDALLVDLLNATGLSSDSPVVAGAVAAAGSETDAMAMLGALGGADSVTVRALTGHLAVPNWPMFTSIVARLFRASAAMEAGTRQADHIHQLQLVDSGLCGLGLCTIDGQRLSLGDAATPFSCQAVLRPFAYAAALGTVGHERLHGHIGCEPAGDASDKTTLNEDDQPFNPFTTSGALLVAALMLGADGKPADVCRSLLGLLTRACARQDAPLEVNEGVHRAEMAASDIHFCVAYLMADAGTFPLPSREAAAAAADQEEAITAAVELYMMLNSVDVTCDSLAVLAGTLAAGGVCPVTGERVLPAEAAKNALCFMQSCGFGVESGEFAFGVGFPAMGCASGAVIVVVPNLFGACFYNPTVNAKNNPVRGMHFCQALSDTFNFHMYDKVDPNTKKIDPKLYAGNDTQAMVNSLLGAASGGDLNALRSLHAMELDLSLSDYDSRAAAHLAASEGHVAVLRFLAEQGVSLFARDRWGNTPLDDAMREGHTETVDTLHRWFDRS